MLCKLLRTSYIKGRCRARRVSVQRSREQEPSACHGCSVRASRLFLPPRLGSAACASSWRYCMWAESIVHVNHNVSEEVHAELCVEMRAHARAVILNTHVHARTCAYSDTFPCLHNITCVFSTVCILGSSSSVFKSPAAAAGC